MPPFRPINSQVNEILGPLPKGGFNFGLFFQKWFYVSPEEGGKCPTDGRKDRNTQGSTTLEDNQPLSVRLFNDGQASTSAGESGSWSRQAAGGELQRKLDALYRLAHAYSLLGYQSICFDAEVLSPLVIGLGNEHPTEKGFRFDWTTGIPCIPSSSIKGVVRLAHLVRELNSFENSEDAKEFWDSASQGILTNSAKMLFGCGEGKKNTAPQEALAGNVIFLDAWPTKLPMLKAEIMNCHYPDYLNKGERGPTEDQQPNPQKFWAVDTKTIGGETLSFRFIVLVAPQAQPYSPMLEDALKAALQEHGLGAKTAIGHGRFEPRKIELPKTTPMPASTGLPVFKQTPNNGVDTFRMSLERLKTQDLPGSIDSIIKQINEEDISDVRTQMGQALIDKAKGTGKTFKVALKEGKAWAKKIAELCEQLNLAL